MKSILVLALTTFTVATFGADLLNCGVLKDSNNRQINGAPSYKVLKSGSIYILEETNSLGVSKSYKLRSTDGDEDYNNYDVVDNSGNSLVHSVTIQNKFKWATLVHQEGYGNTDSRK